MIYSLVAREQVVLVDYSSFNGNFSQVAVDVICFTYRFSPRRIYQKLSDSLQLLTTAFIPLLRTDSFSLQWWNPT